MSKYFPKKHNQNMFAYFKKYFTHKKIPKIGKFLEVSSGFFEHFNQFILDSKAFFFLLIKRQIFHRFTRNIIRISTTNFVRNKMFLLNLNSSTDFFIFSRKKNFSGGLFWFVFHN